MAKTFTFLKHPVSQLINHAFQIVPNLEKAMLIQQKSHSSHPELFIRENQQHLSEVFVEDKNSLFPFLKISAGYKWMHPSSLPFIASSRTKMQLDIFEEQQHMILQINLDFQDEDGQSCILLFFQHQKQHFGPSTGNNKEFSTVEKQILGHMMFQSLQLYYEQTHINREILSKVNRQVSHYNEEISDLKQELQQEKDQNRKYQQMLLKDVFNDILHEFGVNVVLSEECQQKFAAYEGSFIQLKNILIEAVESQVNLGFGLNTNALTLEAWDLHWPDRSTSEIIGATEEKIPERYVKTWQLLNKLEEAARFVINQQLKLTSENVGSACPVPISAPAISDALKNHKKKVLSLMDKYPERWPLLRYEFRPVQNIIQSHRTA